MTKVLGGKNWQCMAKKLGSNEFCGGVDIWGDEIFATG